MKDRPVTGPGPRAPAAQQPARTLAPPPAGQSHGEPPRQAALCLPVAGEAGPPPRATPQAPRPGGCSGGTPEYQRRLPQVPAAPDRPQPSTGQFPNDDPFTFESEKQNLVNRTKNQAVSHEMLRTESVDNFVSRVRIPRPGPLTTRLFGM